MQNPPIPNSEKPSILLVTYYRIIEASLMVECWKEMIQLRFASLFLTILCSIPSNPIQMDSHWIVSQHPSCSHILRTGEPSYNSPQRHTHDHFERSLFMNTPGSALRVQQLHSAPSQLGCASCKYCVQFLDLLGKISLKSGQEFSAQKVCDLWKEGEKHREGDEQN